MHRFYTEFEMDRNIIKYINVNGQLMDLSHPQVMGILNVTPDSFFAGSRKQNETDRIAIEGFLKEHRQKYSNNTIRDFVLDMMNPLLCYRS